MKRKVTGLCALLAALPCLAESPRTESGYRVPTEHPNFSFPRDHGSHPDFRIEWWYITGHLRAENNQRFGFQATFFRYALKPGASAGAKTKLGGDQLFMAHMAVSDLGKRAFYHEERMNRDGWNAFAATDDLRLRNGNWTLRRTTDTNLTLRASIRSDVRMAFDLTPKKPHVVFGENGLSKKGEAASACSWYITFPRLAVRGELTVDGQKHTVTGEAWMDHEISSSQLDKDQVGWDWVSIRLKDHREIMVYILRDADGRPDSYSRLTWIDPRGKMTAYTPDRFAWKAGRTWTSPETGAAYPIDISLSGTDPATGGAFSYRLKPLMDAQELVGKLGGISYWEGACEVLDGNRVIGEAYMELTGYAKELGPALR